MKQAKIFFFKIKKNKSDMRKERNLCVADKRIKGSGTWILHLVKSNLKVIQACKVINPFVNNKVVKKHNHSLPVWP